eukprot:207309_1
MGCSQSHENASEGNPDDIENLYLAPTTPITKVFSSVYKCCGIDDESLATQYITKLNSMWYYRAIDLLYVDKKVWDQMKMPIILEEELFKFIENSRNNQSFIDFKSQTVKNKNIKHVLAQLESNNPSDETSKQIKILE